MKLSNKIKVGKIIEAKGLRGEVKVLFFSGSPDWIDQVEVLYLVASTNPATGSAKNLTRDSNSHLPESELRSVEILNVGETSKPNILTLKLSTIQDRTAAEKLKNTEIYVDEKFLQSKPGESIYLREVMGFVMKDLSDDGTPRLVGTVSGFETNGAQDIAVVTNKSERYLVPLVESFITKIDFEKKEILVKLPEGLLEINRAI